MSSGGMMSQISTVDSSIDLSSTSVPLELTSIVTRRSNSNRLRGSYLLLLRHPLQEPVLSHNDPRRTQKEMHFLACLTSAITIGHMKKFFQNRKRGRPKKKRAWSKTKDCRRLFNQSIYYENLSVSGLPPFCQLAISYFQHIHETVRNLSQCRDRELMNHGP